MSTKRDNIVRLQSVTLWLVLAIGAMFEACVTSPTDGSRTTDRSSVNAFEGYLLVPGEPVRMHAYTTTMTTGGYTEIAATTSSPTVTTNVYGFDLFKWNINVPGGVPDLYWRPGVQGRRLRLMFDTDFESGGVTYRVPLYSHHAGGTALAVDAWQHIANNQGPHGSSVVVATDDFECRTYGGAANESNLDACCDDLAERTRREGTGAMARCQGRERSFTPSLTGGFDIPGETSVTFVPGWKDATDTWHRPRLVAGYNQYMHRRVRVATVNEPSCTVYKTAINSQLGPMEGEAEARLCDLIDMMGWATSEDGVVWYPHNPYWDSVPLAVPDPSVTNLVLRREATQVNFLGDPTVVARGDQGIVAYVGMGSNFADAVSPSGPTATMVTVSISLDGGQSFARTVQVNTGVGIGAVDQPDAAFNPDDGSFWVTWRSNGAAPVFVRGGQVELDGSVIWFDGGQVVGTSGSFGPRVVSFGSGEGRTVVVAYALRPSVRRECSDLDSAIYRAALRTGGGTFSNSDVSFSPMPDSFAVAPCVGGGAASVPAAAGRYQNNFRPGLAIDRRGGATPAVLLTFATQRVVEGVRVGSDLTVARRTIGASGAMPWNDEMRPWIDVSPPSSAAWRFFPELAVRDDSVALSYYETSGAGHDFVGARAMGTRGVLNSAAWLSPTILSSDGDTTIDVMVPAPPLLTTSLTVRGNDYLGLVALPPTRGREQVGGFDRFEGLPGDFYAVWNTRRDRLHVSGYGVAQ